MSVLDKLKALDEERAKLLEDAKKEALEAAHKAIEDLNELGFDYRLVEGPTTSTARKPQGAFRVRGTEASSQRYPVSNLRV